MEFDSCSEPCCCVQYWPVMVAYPEKSEVRRQRGVRAQTSVCLESIPKCPIILCHTTHLPSEDSRVE